MVKTKKVKAASVFVFCIGLFAVAGICGNVECDTMSIEQGIYIASAVIVLLAIDVVIVRWVQREEESMGESEMYDMHKSLEREHLAKTTQDWIHMPEVRKKARLGLPTSRADEKQNSFLG